MIFELAVGAAALAVVTATIRAVLARRAERSTRRALPAPRKDGLEVGDALLHLGDTLWLAGVVELHDGESTLSIFRTPSSRSAEWVLERSPRLPFALLRASDALPEEGSTPDRLPVGGRLLDLVARGSARVVARGAELPSTDARARYTLLRDIGGRVALVVEFESAPRIALLGDEIERALFERLPGS